MLARKIQLRLDSWGEVGTTPMLIPAFSSVVNINSSMNTGIRKLLNTMDEFIKGPILVSAFDLHYVKRFPKLTFSTLIFIDSGGYECSICRSISNLGILNAKMTVPWDRKLHRKTVIKYRGL